MPKTIKLVLKRKYARITTMCKTLCKCGKDRQENVEKGLYKHENVYYNRVNIKFKRKEWMEEKRKKIRDCFLNYQDIYFKQQGDKYTANQMAAIATRMDYNLSKNELIRILNND